MYAVSAQLVLVLSGFVLNNVNNNYDNTNVGARLSFKTKRSIDLANKAKNKFFIRALVVSADEHDLKKQRNEES